MQVDVRGTIFEVFQYGSLILSIVTILFLFLRARINKQWIVDVPMIVLMLHNVLYYAVLFISSMFVVIPDQHLFFTSWSSALRFHGYATLFMLAVFNYARERYKNKWGV